MGKKKYNTWLGDPDYNASRVKLTSADYIYLQKSRESDGRSPPKEMLLPIRDGPGFFLGLPSGPGGSSYVGIPQNTEGNFMVVGGNGSGKSAGIAKPTLKTWQGPICATDVKGELSLCYEELSDQGLVTRPYLVFDPTQPEGPGYDPLWLLSHDGEDNLLNNVREIAMAIAPVSPEDKQPFWAETEQGVVAAALLYYFKLGLSFSEIMCKILSSSTSELCKTLVQSQDVCVRILLGEMAVMKPETLANIDRGMRNKLMLFAADPYISHAFRGQREGASCFNWSDLDHYVECDFTTQVLHAQWHGASRQFIGKILGCDPTRITQGTCMRHGFLLSHSRFHLQFRQAVFTALDSRKFRTQALTQVYKLIDRVHVVF